MMFSTSLKELVHSHSSVLCSQDSSLYLSFAFVRQVNSSSNSLSRSSASCVTTRYVLFCIVYVVV